MSTKSSKQQKNRGLAYLVLGLAFILVIGVLVGFSSRTATAHALSNTTLGIQSSANLDASFAADEQYWNAHCNHGWGSDSTCNTIVAKAQSCQINDGSSYCSEYKAYMQKFLDQ